MTIFHMQLKEQVVFPQESQDSSENIYCPGFQAGLHLYSKDRALAHAGIFVVAKAEECIPALSLAKARGN